LPLLPLTQTVFLQRFTLFFRSSEASQSPAFDNSYPNFGHSAGTYWGANCKKKEVDWNSARPAAENRGRVREIHKKQRNAGIELNEAGPSDLRPAELERKVRRR